MIESDVVNQKKIQEMKLDEQGLSPYIYLPKNTMVGSTITNVTFRKLAEDHI